MNHALIQKNGRDHNYETLVIRKYFDELMMVDAVRTVVVLFLQYISDNFAMEYDRVHHKAFALCQRDDALGTRKGSITTATTLFLPPTN